MANFSVQITNESMNLLRANSTGEFHPCGPQQSDGSWIIQLSEATFERICNLMLADETIDEALARIFATLRGLN